MNNITAIPAAHGASLADVVNIRTYLTDMGRLPEYSGAAWSIRAAAPAAGHAAGDAVDGSPGRPSAVPAPVVRH